MDHRQHYNNFSISLTAAGGAGQGPTEAEIEARKQAAIKALKASVRIPRVGSTEMELDRKFFMSSTFKKLAFQAYAAFRKNLSIRVTGTAFEFFEAQDGCPAIVAEQAVVRLTTKESGSQSGFLALLCL